VASSSKYRESFVSLNDINFIWSEWCHFLSLHYQEFWKLSEVCLQHSLCYSMMTFLYIMQTPGILMYASNAGWWFAHHHYEMKIDIPTYHCSISSSSCWYILHHSTHCLSSSLYSTPLLGFLYGHATPPSPHHSSSSGPHCICIDHHSFHRSFSMLVLIIWLHHSHL